MIKLFILFYWNALIKYRHPTPESTPAACSCLLWSNMAISIFRVLQAYGRRRRHWQRNSSQHSTNRITPLRDIWIQSWRKQLAYRKRIRRDVWRYCVTMSILEPIMMFMLISPGSVIACVSFTYTKKNFKILYCLPFRHIFLFHLRDVYSIYSWKGIVK
jgi:hypothetical protein